MWATVRIFALRNKKTIILNSLHHIQMSGATEARNLSYSYKMKTIKIITQIYVQVLMEKA